ncbi:MAG: biopolymer transporter ExbD [Acidobacteria bacterium]|nr:biopolymer transporter ExbD [Acidobacteriota bacterium]
MAFTSPDGRTSTSLSEINVTPLVDVMLVLLVIFMVTTPIIQSGIEVNLPRTRHVKTFHPRQQYVISIDRNDNLYFMTQPININRLVERLNVEIGQHSGPEGENREPVYLRADGDVRFAVVVKVMDVLREGGFTNIQIVTHPIIDKSTS